MLFVLTQKDSGKKFLVSKQNVTMVEVNEKADVGGTVISTSDGKQRVVEEDLCCIADKMGCGHCQDDLGAAGHSAPS